MDRSLTAEDYRLLDRLNASPPRRAFQPAPRLAELPGWFRRVVAEQAAWLGIPLPGEIAAQDEPAAAAAPVREAA